MACECGNQNGGVRWATVSRVSTTTTPPAVQFPGDQTDIPIRLSIQNADWVRNNLDLGDRVMVAEVAEGQWAIIRWLFTLP